jgi:methyl-accepting chemotaxis protein
MEEFRSATEKNGSPSGQERYVRRWLWLLTAAGVAAPTLLASLVFSITDVRAGPAMAVLAVAVVVILAVVMVHLLAMARLASPLEEIDGALAELAAGRRDGAFSNIGENRNFARTAQALIAIRERLVELEARDIADADADDETVQGEEIPGIDAEALGSLLGDATNAIVSEANALHDEAREIADLVGMAGDATAKLGQSVTQAGEEAQVASQAIGRLESEIEKIGGQVLHSATIAAGAVQEMHKANEIVGKLGEAAREISGVADLINNIAGQTNLLALNATIEAARAGDAGKGFAVVAGEVKNLANQTAKATEGINDQIQAIQDQTTVAVEAIGMVSGVIAEIFDLATDVAGEVEEQGDKLQELAGGIGRIAGISVDWRAKVAAASPWPERRPAWSGTPKDCASA